jgi:hypothetical protein
MRTREKIAWLIVGAVLADNLRIGLQNHELRQEFINMVNQNRKLVDKCKILTGYIRVEDAGKAYVDLEFYDITHE